MTAFMAAGFGDEVHCSNCVHCKMWIQRRRVAYCAKDGITAETLAIVPDSSADYCEECRNARR